MELPGLLAPGIVHVAGAGPRQKASPDDVQVLNTHHRPKLLHRSPWEAAAAPEWVPCAENRSGEGQGPGSVAWPRLPSAHSHGSPFQKGTMVQIVIYCSRTNVINDHLL